MTGLRRLRLFFGGIPACELFNYGNLSRFAGVSGAGARRRNPERSEGSRFGNDLGCSTSEPEHGTRTGTGNLIAGE